MTDETPQQSRRAQCPVCSHSIRVAENRLVPHTRRPWVTMLKGSAHWCPGSDMLLSDIERSQS